MEARLDKLLFEAASGFTVAEERRTFLEFACRGDDERRKRIEALLDLQRDAEEFFDIQPKVVESGEALAGQDGIDADIGPYRLIDRLGAGGCGVVYLAEQRVPMRRKVALKIVRLGMDTESVIARFEVEREALAMMDHPNIARVLDAGTTAAGRPYFVMELVDGERITSFCDRKRLSIRDRLELFILVCEAIQHAHQKGVIHRDIKPSNILVREHDGRAVPKVIDFGIAKATAGGIIEDATFTLHGQFLGTPAYMSPEQAEGGRDVDTRSDIYSLGALLCELLTGGPPFHPDQFKDRGVEEIRSILREEETGVPSERFVRWPSEEIRGIAESRAADPHRLKLQISGDLDWIVMKAVEKERERRYETANGLAVDVRRYLSEEPVLARPPSRGYLLLKLFRRNRIAFAAGGVAVFGLLTGFGVSTWLFLREREARQEQSRLGREAEVARATEVRLLELRRMADLVAKAAVHVRYQEMEKADVLLAGLPDDQVPLSLEAVDTLKAVADWNLTKGRWETAAARFRALVPVLASVDMTDTDQMSRLLLPSASAIKEWGTQEEYEVVRELMIRRFIETSNPAVAAQMVKAALLDAADPETIAELSPLSAVIEPAARPPESEANRYIAAWRQFSLALLAYRQGHLDTAGYWARTSAASQESAGSLTASNRILLAMVDFRQGRRVEAAAALKTAAEELEKWESEPFQLGVSLELWFDWANARIFFQEAERLVNGSGG